MKIFILAHDLGTTSNKATLYDRNGAYAAQQAAYEKIYPIFEASYDQLVPIFDMIAEAE